MSPVLPCPPWTPEMRTPTTGRGRPVSVPALPAVMKMMMKWWRFVWLSSLVASRDGIAKTSKMRFFVSLLKNTNPKIEFYSRFSPSPLSIKQFLDFGEEILTTTTTGACLPQYLLLVLRLGLIYRQPAPVKHYTRLWHFNSLLLW